jgi:hypothetical protein
MSERARFKVKVGSVEIELEGPEEKVISEYTKAFDWASTQKTPQVDVENTEDADQTEKVEKQDKRGGVRPQTVAPTIKALITSEYFKLPNRRSIENVLEEFKKKGLPYTGKKQHNAVLISLKRRLQDGTLKGHEEEGKWTFWAE